MKILKFFFSLVLIIVISGVLIGGYLGFVPGVNQIFGSNKPISLGEKYSQEDYDRLIKRNGVEEIKITSNVSVEDSLRYEGQHSFESSITSGEATSMVNDNPYKYFPFKMVQIRFNPDGSVEASGLVSIDTLFSFVAATGGTKYDLNKVKDYLKVPLGTIPVYLKASGSITNNAPSITWQSAKIGRLSVPVDLANKYSSQIDDFIAERINHVPNLKLEKLEVVDSKLNFKGIIPNKKFFVAK